MRHVQGTKSRNTYIYRRKNQQSQAVSQWPDTSSSLRNLISFPVVTSWRFHMTSCLMTFCCRQIAQDEEMRGAVDSSGATRPFLKGSFMLTHLPYPEKLSVARKAARWRAPRSPTMGGRPHLHTDHATKSQAAERNRPCYRSQTPQ